MKTLILITTLIFSFTFVAAEASEPCKGILIPAEIQSSKIIFEIPTYDEYVRNVVLESMKYGITIDEEDILNEFTYKKVRNVKIKIIESTYTGDYTIMTKDEVNALEGNAKFIFQEKFINNLVSDNSAKFERYTAFMLTDVSSSTQYTLVDPSQDDSSNCIVKNEEYKFNELIEIIQK